MAYGETSNILPIKDNLQLYTLHNRKCDPNDANFATSGNVTWIQTLNSLNGSIVGCNEGYVLEGSPEISCDEKGEYYFYTSKKVCAALLIL